MLPQELIDSLIHTEGFNKEAFLEVHASGEQITSVRLNPSKPVQVPNIKSRIPWSEYGYYLNSRPSFTFDPLFHAGTYYVQEASSMFLEQALKQTIDLSQPLKVLDLSAAPGGKSTHIQSLISQQSLLVSNEVIRSRANILKDNIIKWGSSNVIITNNDPKDFERLPGYFDVIVVDAPCSGSGLFRRDPDAIDEWSLNNVQLCSQRQQRILADVWPSLKEEGLLIYSTCSYSKEEDEDILNWIDTHLPSVNCPLTVKDEWNIIETSSVNGSKGYRFWPDKVMGEGFFIACYKKKGGKKNTVLKIKNKPSAAGKKEIAVIEQWIRTQNQYFIMHENTVYAWPADLKDDFAFLLEKLRVIYSGILAGELIRDKLIPSHALAMSGLAATTSFFDADYEQAIRYLQRKDLVAETEARGWQLVKYEGHILGWLNVLPNRINNYYPKELRILKENPDL